MEAKEPPQKSFLVQKYARLGLGLYSLVGYSVAGEETVCQIPELDVCFDIGRAPAFALTSNILCITHAHMDHLAGLPYYLSQRHFQGMKPGVVLLPRELVPGVDAMLRAWREVERQGTPYRLVPMEAGGVHEVRRDFIIRAFATQHGGPSLGYALVSVREKLKPEYLGIEGAKLAQMRKEGVEIQYTLEVPLVAFTGDTGPGRVFEEPDVQNARTLITEVTFFDSEHKTKAKAGRHMHVDHFAQVLGKLKNEQIILTHLSRRTGIRRAKSILRRKVGSAAMERIHFLMDLADAPAAGEVESGGQGE